MEAIGDPGLSCIQMAGGVTQIAEEEAVEVDVMGGGAKRFVRGDKRM